MTNIIAVLTALAEPTRLRAIEIIWDGREHCVCELMEVLEREQSCMSRHMTALKKVGLVIDRRDAQWVRYRRNPELPKATLKLVEAVLEHTKSGKGKRREVLC
ncbi:MAG: metalloregulator ArsR/SmtB family transcription factor [Alphaproteobacteria bacterium]|nr:metalloregulator ArsR/SmtB family transcription factor [Alphaproteobacteria bacterium]